ncbi:rap guanine nucleotide exchange factor 5-like isoform X1 [Babesia caballi]|uniref:Rap guanine nucleotide exchange factor 5-like isoform X1 n=1 Tax=Babesia caballi TaxID=5871 RepID=A0AAV4LR65_BABCB|nr:rap guanine nucleotide exchange factor 5-like isoform X1 [Babesia caballi]
MSEDCATWDKDSLQRGLYAGPFAYGFTFGARWNNKDNWSDLHTELQQKVNALTSSLRKLKSDLDSIPVPSSWPTSYQDPTTNSHPNPNPNPESPAHQTADSSLSVGSAASAATLLGAGGAVVYYLDIGGFGTLVKSFF